jgi:hypothetical protein
VGSPSNLPTAVGGHLGPNQYTATHCQGAGIPVVSGTTAHDIVEVDVTNSLLGSSTEGRNFTEVKSQGSWKIDGITQ